MNRRWGWTCGIAAALLACGGAALTGFALKAAAGAAGGKPQPALEFAAREVVHPVLARLPAEVEFSGPLVAPQTAVVRAKAGGTLLGLTVGEGSRVRAGQVLGRIELPDLASRAAERQANVEAARASLIQAERTHAGNEHLAAQQFISPIALANSRAALDAARAQLDAAQAALATVRVGLRDATLLAPIPGIVARRHVLPGEKVSPEQPLLTIVDLARLELAGSVGTHEVSRIAAGMAVQVEVEGAAQPVTGRIARIAPAAEPGTRSIVVAIELPNPGELLRAGQYALARVTLADDADRLTLPETALAASDGQDQVWVIESGVLARRAVTLGRRDARAGRVEVLQGVTPSSVVLGARFDNLREGARALVVAGKAAPAAPPARAAVVAAAAASAPAVK